MDNRVRAHRLSRAAKPPSDRSYLTKNVAKLSLPAACPSLVLEIWSQRTRAIKAGGASN